MQKNLGGMLKGIQQLQQRMDAIQKDISEAVFEGSAAQGLVKVEMTGKGEVKRINIDPSVLHEGADTVADLVTVAAQKAYIAKEAMAKEKLSSIAGGLSPLGIKIPGLG